MFFKSAMYVVHGRLHLSTGYVHADGGDGRGDGGGGGGGRIALHYKTGHIGGDIKTYGGRGVETGAAGTIYALDQSSSSKVIIIFCLIWIVHSIIPYVCRRILGVYMYVTERPY